MARGDRDHRDDGCGGLVLLMFASLAVVGTLAVKIKSWART